MESLHDRIELLGKEEFGINEAPRVMDELTAFSGRALLLAAVGTSLVHAKSAVYVAVMALEGFPIGGATTAPMSRGYVRRVRAALTDEDAREVVRLATTMYPEVSTHVDMLTGRWRSDPSRSRNWGRR